MNGRPITEEDLHGYVDHALSATRHAEVADYLADNPDVAKRVKGYSDQRDLLRGALASVPNEPLPPQLNLTRIIEQRRRRWAPVRWAAAAALLLVIGGAAGWSLHGIAGPSSEGVGALAQEAANTYRVYAPDHTRPVEIRAADRAALVDWASDRLGRPVTVPDLSASGYRFMGGRVVVTSHGPAVMLMYDDDRGARLLMLARTMAVDQDTAMSVSSQGSVTRVQLG